MVLCVASLTAATIGWGAAGPASLSDQAMSLAQQKRFDEAEPLWKQALNFDFNTDCALGLARSKQGKREPAIRAWRQAEGSERSRGRKTRVVAAATRESGVSRGASDAAVPRNGAE